MEVNVHHAKTNLSKLIAAVESGEEVIIARNGKPAVKMVLADPPPRFERVGGGLKGKLNLPENWEEEWKKMDKEIEDLMVNAPLTTNGDI
jgi:prevent-host-death family protein